MLTMPHF